MAVTNRIQKAHIMREKWIFRNEYDVIIQYAKLAYRHMDVFKSMLFGMCSRVVCKKAQLIQKDSCSCALTTSLHSPCTLKIFRGECNQKARTYYKTFHGFAPAKNVVNNTKCFVQMFFIHHYFFILFLLLNILYEFSFQSL